MNPPELYYDQILPIAITCHNANMQWRKYYEQGEGQTWDELSPQTRNGVMDGVKGALMGLTSAQLHKAWMADCRANGWVYGPVKDTEKKTHPCLVSYDQLSIEDRAKDRLFLGIVAAFKAAFDQTNVEQQVHARRMARREMRLMSTPSPRPPGVDPPSHRDLLMEAITGRTK